MILHLCTEKKKVIYYQIAENKMKTVFILKYLKQVSGIRQVMQGNKWKPEFPW